MGDKKDTTGAADTTSCLEERVTEINLLTPSSSTRTWGHQMKLTGVSCKTIQKSRPVEHLPKGRHKCRKLSVHILIREIHSVT